MHFIHLERMKKTARLNSLLNFTLLIAMVFVFSSCNKCDEPLNRLTGDELIENSIVKVMANPPAEPELIREASDFNVPIQISTDNGYTFSQMDFNKYSIVCFPTNTYCDASFDREISLDYLNKVVKYTMGITVCDMCEYRVSQAHYVLISKIPDDFTFEYELIELN